MEGPPRKKARQSVTQGRNSAETPSPKTVAAVGGQRQSKVGKNSKASSSKLVRHAPGQDGFPDMARRDSRNNRRCGKIKKDNKPCGQPAKINNGRRDFGYCLKHDPSIPRCRAMMRNGERCTGRVDYGLGFCGNHWDPDDFPEVDDPESETDLDVPVGQIWRMYYKVLYGRSFSVSQCWELGVSSRLIHRQVLSCSSSSS